MQFVIEAALDRRVVSATPMTHTPMDCTPMDCTPMDCTPVSALPDTAIARLPSALLSVAQIVALAEARLRWYGFADWRVADILCHPDHSHTDLAVSVEICGRDGNVATMTIARDCGTAEIAVRLPAALRLPATPLPPVANERRQDKRGEITDRAARFGRTYAPVRMPRPGLRTASRA